METGRDIEPVRLRRVSSEQSGSDSAVSTSTAVYAARRPSGMNSEVNAVAAVASDVHATTIQLCSSPQTKLASGTASAPTSGVESENNDSELEGRFQEFACNICFETAYNPVLTLCGHLYCWPCLHQWIERNKKNPLCPVCKAGTGADKVIPIYGRGTESKDPRVSASDVPDRPPGQRPAPTESPRDRNRADANGNFFRPFYGAYNAGRVGGHQYFTVGGGLGMLPELLGMQFSVNLQMGGRNPSERLTAQQTFPSRLALMIGVMILLAIFLY